MEHRWSARKPHECSVAIDSPFRTQAIGWMRNIGLGGMFVETGALVLPTNAPVLVGFTFVMKDEYEEPFRLPGLVVRRTPAGVGIMFLETAADKLGALRRALYAEPRTRAVQPPKVKGVEAYRPESVNRIARETGG
jgi:hypothetical protein